jgi:tripartite-type tricarboxylate transporter receptor subunit TctC
MKKNSIKSNTYIEIVTAATAVASLATIPLSQAQSGAFPTKPIRMTVSSGTGGGLDFVSRLVAVPMSESLGYSVVVDNRAGASGSIAAEIAAAAPADGHTLMMLSASLVVYGIVNKTRYDLYRDFDAVSQVAASPYILTVHPSVPAKSVKELIAYAKVNPTKLSYASTGNASFAHLANRTAGEQHRHARDPRAVQRRGRGADGIAIRTSANEHPQRRLHTRPGAHAKTARARHRQHRAQ